MCEIKIENNPKMSSAISTVKDAFTVDSSDLQKAIEDVVNNKLEYLGCPLSISYRELLLTALRTVECLLDCESIQLNFSGDK